MSAACVPPVKALTKPLANKSSSIPSAKMISPIDSHQVLRGIWSAAGLSDTHLQLADLTGADPVLPSSFAVGTAAQTSIAAAALAAAALGHLRNGVQQRIAVDMQHAALECTGHFSVDGRAPVIWDKLSGLYRCRSGWVRVHANFAHHRDGALRVLGLPAGADTERATVEAALLQWDAFGFEQACAGAGLVVAAVRRFDEWDAHPHSQAIAAAPLITLEKIGDAAPRALPALPTAAPPLQGVRVLDLTRILAGPVCGRTLAAYGADVMLLNAPHLPNIEHIADTSRGKLSAQVDLRTADGRDTLRGLLRDAHVMVQGYRPGGLAAHGFGAADAAALGPGLVYVSLSAYGDSGPWGGRRGFDSLVQTATGFNHAEAQAFHQAQARQMAGPGPPAQNDGAVQPKAMPVQILDYASGFLMAFAVSAALLRQQQEGGSWHARISLARTAQWLRSLGRIEGGFNVTAPASDAYLETTASGWGEMRAIKHAAQFSHTPARWSRPSVRPGTHAPVWPV